jgi:CubicO group peptidase (beta-lactamase class C family)
MSEPLPDLLPETSRALLHRIAVAQAEGRTPSLLGAVVRDGRPVWIGSRGRLPEHAQEADVQYRIGSITKTFVAVLVMRLREEGRLDLADPVERHLGPTKADGLTIAQLLAHTSGLAADPPGPWWERTPGDLRPELADVLGEAPPPHPAGRRFHYSNPAFALLGGVVERLRDGTPWYEVLRREVLEPLGMRRTALRPDPPHASGFAVHPWAELVQPEVVHEDTGLMAPAGQLWSTAADLCRWAAFLSDGEKGVLGADALAEMRCPSSPGGEYGLGLQLLSPGLAGHTGSMPGFVSALWLSIEEGVGAVVLANATSGLATGTLAADLVRIVTEREPRIPAPWQPCSDPDPDLLALTGPWYWGAAPFALRVRAGRDLDIVPLSDTGRASRFVPAGDGAWTGLDGYHTGETLRPVRAADGSAVTHLELGSFVLTRAPYDPAAPVPGGTPAEGWTTSLRHDGQGCQGSPQAVRRAAR